MSHYLDRLSLQHEAYFRDARKLRDAAELAERLYADPQHPAVLAMRAAALDAEAKAGEIGREMRADPDYSEWAQSMIADILASADCDTETLPRLGDDTRFASDRDRPPTADETRRFAIRAAERLAMYVETCGPAELVDAEVRRLCQICGVDPSRPMPLNLHISLN